VLTLFSVRNPTFDEESVTGVPLQLEGPVSVMVSVVGWPEATVVAEAVRLSTLTALATTETVAVLVTVR
jgi:hypothetical protein